MRLVGSSDFSASALTDEERQFLRAALLSWGGAPRNPARMAALIGVPVGDLHRVCRHHAEAIERGFALAPQQWSDILLLAELGFGSEVLGSGQECSIAAGWDDAAAFSTLRWIQGRLLAAGALLPRQRP